LPTFSPFATTIHQESYHCHGASSHQLSCFEENLPTTPSELYQEFANTYDIHVLFCMEMIICIIGLVKLVTIKLEKKLCLKIIRFWKFWVDMVYKMSTRDDEKGIVELEIIIGQWKCSKLEVARFNFATLKILVQWIFYYASLQSKNSTNPNLEVL
jgi:hypothetical protein